ncbi:MAG: alpha/beta hydrolase [Tepidisphaeraceae bacterium]
MRTALPVIVSLILTMTSSAASAQSATTRPTTGLETTPQSIAGADAHVYRDAKPDPLRLFVFKPKHWKPDDRRPAFVFFFGGGWNRGTPERSAGWARTAAKWGLVGIAPDYRTRDRFGTTAKESVSDARAAIRWIQDHATELGIDPSRLVVGGSSAGGHLALWTAIEKAPPGSRAEDSPTTKPAALVLISAASDTAFPHFAARMGGDPEALSPVHQLDKTMPPVIAFHGDADATVPHRHAVALRDKLVARGNECELTTVPGGSHGFTQQMPQWREKAQDAICAFLEKQQLLPDARSSVP